MILRTKCIVCGLGILFSGSCPAVIVAGANGQGNTTVADLDASLGTDFPYYENVVRLGGVSGVYLGQNGMDGWIVTANHAGSPSQVTIAGSAYTVADSFAIAGADMRMHRIPFSGSSPALPNVSATTSSPTIGTEVVMIGYGRTRQEAAATSSTTSDAVTVGGSNAGYHWGSSTTKRWGTNTIDPSPSRYFGIQGGLNVTNYPGVGISYITTFDDPGSGNYLLSNEAQGAAGDTGGASFVFADGEWQLAGITTHVLPNSGQTGNTAAFGNLTTALDFASYATPIEGVVGAPLGQFIPIPEPSTALLSLYGIGLLAQRRRGVAA